MSRIIKLCVFSLILLISSLANASNKLPISLAFKVLETCDLSFEPTIDLGILSKTGIDFNTRPFFVDVLYCESSSYLTFNAQEYISASSPYEADLNLGGQGKGIIRLFSNNEKMKLNGQSRGCLGQGPRTCRIDTQVFIAQDADTGKFRLPISVGYAFD